MPSDIGVRVQTTLAVARSEHAASNPWPIVLTTAWPRAVLQCLFFTVLGAAVGGPGAGDFCYVGSLAMITMLGSVVDIADVATVEKWSGTLYRLRLSSMPIFVVFLLRAVPTMVQSFGALLLCLAIVGPVTGRGDLSMRLLPALPVYLLMIATGAAAGLAVAVLAVGRRAEVTASNSFAYLVIAAGGLVVADDEAPVLGRLGRVLPLSNGVDAVRALLGGRPWVGHLVAEVAVGAVWLVVAVLLLRWQDQRARRAGLDDYT